MQLHDISDKRLSWKKTVTTFLLTFSRRTQLTLWGFVSSISVICLFLELFLLSVSFSLGSLIYSSWWWGLPNLNIQPLPSGEFQICFDMAYWIPPHEFSYSVIHLLIYSFSIYLKCTRWTLFHSETGRADIIILISGQWIEIQGG